MKAYSILLKKRQKISKSDIIIFTRHLSTLINAGFQLTQALIAIREGHEKAAMRELLTQINDEVSEGHSLHQALQKHPECFSKLYCNLIQVGEKTSALDIMLIRIANYQEKMNQLKSKLKKTLFYPLSIVAVAILVAVVIMLFVIPQFEAMFKTFGSNLPLFTQQVIYLSELLHRYGWLVLLLILSTILFISRKRHTSEKFAYWLDKQLLKIKILGPLLRKGVIARFARTMATTLSAGMPIMEALKIATDTIDNYVYKKAMINAREDIKIGNPIYKAIADSSLFPNMVVQMIAIGEKSGELEKMFNKTADYFEEDVDNTIANLNNALEPLILLLLGLIIGSFVLAMYLPIFKMGSII